MKSPLVVRTACLFGALVGNMTAPLTAQGVGGLVGKVTDASNNLAIRGAEVRLDGDRFRTVTDSGGEWRLRSIPAGVHTLAVTLPGYRPTQRDQIVVRSGEITRVDARLAPVAIQLSDLVAVGVQDPVLDPMATASAQRITREDLRRLPVSTLEDAIALQAGVVSGSYRGGRIGQQAFVLDGFGVKNQLDASTGAIGIHIPTDFITEASLITNGFSARYGQAISGLISVTTRDGGDSWHGRLAYETDRPLSGAADLGLDRMILSADGPLIGRTTFVGIIDLSAQLDADPANAPAPVEPRDPRSTSPAPLPHNSGEVWTGGGKITVPVGNRIIGRIFGLLSRDQRYLFDQQYKYDPNFGPGSRTDGTLVTSQWQLLPKQDSNHPFLGDLRFGYFDRSFARGAVDAPDYSFGAFTGHHLTIQGEELAKAQDTLGTRAAVTGFVPPQFSSNTPWGVPAFFLGGAAHGEIAWNKFTELRSQLDMSWSAGPNTDFYFGGMNAAQDVKTYQRVLASLPAGDSVPNPTASSFTPSISALYTEAQIRASDLAITAGLRYDAFSPGADLHNSTLGARSSLNPRLGVSTVLKNATFVVSVGKFSQPPDLQYLIDAAFDDSTRTGRFRQGNPNLGFESATQFEMSARVRLRERSTIKVNVYDKRLDGLVSSVPINVNPDSSVFANADVGEVIGAEVIFERERHNGIGVRLAVVAQRAQATVTNAFELRRLVIIDPITHDTLSAGRNQFPLDYDRRLSVIAAVDAESRPDAGPRIFGTRPFGMISGALVGRYASGLPYTLTSTLGDTLLGPINGQRLPAQWSIDMLLRRPVRFGRVNGGLYLDIRNLTNRANQPSVRRDTGLPTPSNATITRLADDAYNANPGAIPYESPRYRRWADLNSDGVLSGRSELYPLYLSAAKDYTAPLFVYGPPRSIRFGLEVVF